MMILGGGLASLIPKRDTESPEDIIEKIDSMEVVSEEPKNVKALRENKEAEVLRQAQDKEAEVKAAKKTGEKQSAEEAVPVKRKKLNVIEEIEELDDEEIPMPEPPAVTPLTIDPETGMIVEPVSEEAEKTETAQGEPKVVTARVKVVEETDEAVTEKVKAKLKKAPKAGVKKKAKTKVSVPEDQSDPTSRLLGESIEYIAAGDIGVNSLQPRRSFGAEGMEELKRSLDQHGMLQPLVVAEKEDGSGYVLIAGERRLRAVKELKWDEVPTVVRRNVTGDRNRLELALVENVQRQNLNPVEEAMGYQRLNEEYGMTHEEIGERVGRSRVGITNIIRLLQLPAEIQRGLTESKISVGHARAILMIPDEEKQLRFYAHVVDEGLTVRKAENRARNIQRTMKLSDPLRRKNRGRPEVALKYDGPLQERYGHNARVKFLSAKNRFEVVFSAYSEEEVEELVGRLLGTRELPQDVDKDVTED